MIMILFVDEISLYFYQAVWKVTTNKLLQLCTARTVWSDAVIRLGPSWSFPVNVLAI